jgi:hypothetical protein
MNGNKGQPAPQPPTPPQHQLNVGVPPILGTPPTAAPPDDKIIRPKWEEGDRVDYVPRGMSQAPSVMATSLGQGLIGGSFGAAAQRAKEEQEGRRHRAVIDKPMPDGNYRIILTDSCETVWASADEIESLGVIDKLADMVGPESRSLKDGLKELEEKETREGTTD